MPVTATLSREFYEKFGDSIVVELINLLNTVDADSKASLRELNDANFARFDATMKQQFAEQNARLEPRFAEITANFARIDESIKRQSAELKSEMLRWMFLFFTGSALANVLLR